MARKDAAAREYRVFLASIDPLAGSCGCADYVKASLGLCKHIIAVAAARPARPGRQRPSLDGSPMRWDPIRPLDGPGDWLARVTCGETSWSAVVALQWGRR